MKSKDWIILLGGAYLLSKIGAGQGKKPPASGMPQIDVIGTAQTLADPLGILRKIIKPGPWLRLPTGPWIKPGPWLPTSTAKTVKKKAMTPAVFHQAESLLASVGLGTGLYKAPTKQGMINNAEQMLKSVGLGLGLYSALPTAQAIPTTPKKPVQVVGAGFDPVLSAKYNRPVTWAEGNALANMQGHMKSKGISNVGKNIATHTLRKTTIGRHKVHTSSGRTQTRITKARKPSARVQHNINRAKAARQAAYQRVHG